MFQLIPYFSLFRVILGSGVEVAAAGVVAAAVCGELAPEVAAVRGQLAAEHSYEEGLLSFALFAAVSQLERGKEQKEGQLDKRHKITEERRVLWYLQFDMICMILSTLELVETILAREFKNTSITTRAFGFNPDIF